MKNISYPMTWTFAEIDKACVEAGEDPFDPTDSPFKGFTDEMIDGLGKAQALLWSMGFQLDRDKQTITITGHEALCAFEAYTTKVHHAYEGLTDEQFELLYNENRNEWWDGFVGGGDDSVDYCGSMPSMLHGGLSRLWLAAVK